MVQPMVSEQSVESDKVTVISIDSHVGPAPEVLRPYCAKAYLDDFDAFATEFEASNPEMHGVDFNMFSEAYVLHMMETLSRPLMHYDPHERLHDMDADGIAAEVVYHGALNGAPIPFVEAFGVGATMPRDTSSRATELATEGVGIYNRWLADYWAAVAFKVAANGMQALGGYAQLPEYDMERYFPRGQTCHGRRWC